MSLNEPKFLSRFLLVGIWLLWMGVIFAFSTQSWGGAETRSTLDQLLTLLLPSLRERLTMDDLSQINFILRKLAHFTEYAILTALGYWGWHKGLGRSPQQSLYFALLGAILFAISDEFHQQFVSGRTSLLTDVLIDSLGASVMATVLQQWHVRPTLATESESKQTS